MRFPEVGGYYPLGSKPISTDSVGYYFESNAISLLYLIIKFILCFSRLKDMKFFNKTVKNSSTVCKFTMWKLLEQFRTIPVIQKIKFVFRT